MSDDAITENLAFDFGFTIPATRKVMELMREFEEALPDDPEGQERAFVNAVRSAWVAGEAWAVQWVDRAAFTRPGSS